MHKVELQLHNKEAEWLDNLEAASRHFSSQLSSIKPRWKKERKWGFPGGSEVKVSASEAGDAG